MNYRELRAEMRRVMREVTTDPHEAATIIRPLIDEENIDAILKDALPLILRRFVRGMRLHPVDGDNMPVYVPSVGWKDMRDLTAVECEEVAAEYDRLAAENKAKAREFKRWAHDMNAAGVEHLGELARFKQMMSERTRDGLQRARERGRKLGRPVLVTVEDKQWMLGQYEAGVKAADIASDMNIRGLRRQNGTTWDVSSVHAMLSKIRKRGIGA